MMKPSFGLRASQQLALTPQLQQSIRLLQMSTAELEQEIDRFLAENPLLEFADAGSAEAADEGSPKNDQESANAETGLDEGQPSSIEGWSTSSGPKASQSDDADDADWWEDQRAQPLSLRSHLREQVLGLSLSERDRAWLDALIESLDDDGYLRDSLEELEASMAELFVEAFGERLDSDELQLGLKLLQSLDPVGVGARSLQECLLLQLAAIEKAARAKPAKEAQAAQFRVAHQLLADPELLKALGAKEFGGICKSLHCERGLLKEALALIQRLDPRPGARFQSNAAESVIPDVIAYRTAGRAGMTWQVRLNESAVPRLSINPLYASLIKQEKSGMAAQLQEARWMIKNIQQRFDTILRVAQAIAAEQQAFFELGEVGMKPLVLREIAERCDLHESTVSRVTSQKYILTPRGTFELKYFFASHVSTEGGGVASSTAIRAKIRQWIAQEDPKKPLSDQQIADRFGKEGVQVARRTIAKYREALRIEPVSQRKQL